MRLLGRFFVDHPRSVGETYAEHMQVASSFGVRMIVGGLACLVHALLPSLFEKTGSNMIRKLHDRMVVNRTSEGNSGATIEGAGARN